jgi:hypothetical protein
MAIKITQGEAVLFDSVTGLAFGPVFGDYEEAEDFLKWTETETAAELSDMEPRAVAGLVFDFRKEREGAPVRGDAADLEAVRDYVAAEWLRHGEALSKMREAPAFLRHVQALKAEEAELYAGRTLRSYAEAGLAAVSRKAERRADLAVDNAVSFYVRDNGDCVPVEVVEGIQAEVEQLTGAEN